MHSASLFLNKLALHKVLYSGERLFMWQLFPLFPFCVYKSMAAFCFVANRSHWDLSYIDLTARQYYEQNTNNVATIHRQKTPSWTQPACIYEPHRTTSLLNAEDQMGVKQQSVFVKSTSLTTSMRVYTCAYHVRDNSRLVPWCDRPQDQSSCGWYFSPHLPHITIHQAIYIRPVCSFPD